jgi:MFS transporter
MDQNTPIGRKPSVLLSYAISILGIFLLWLLQHDPTTVLLTGFIVCFGSMMGSRGPLISATAMKIFRGKRVGTIYGTISIGSGLGSAFGSWSSGLIHVDPELQSVARLRTCERCARDGSLPGCTRLEALGVSKATCNPPCHRAFQQKNKANPRAQSLDCGVLFK